MQLRSFGSAREVPFYHPQRKAARLVPSRTMDFGKPRGDGARDLLAWVAHHTFIDHDLELDVINQGTFNRARLLSTD